MPLRAMKPCGHPGCGRATRERFCTQHQESTPDPAPWRSTRTSSSARGYGAAWQRLRRLVLSEEPICRACQRAAASMVDHIVNKAAGGTDDRANLQGICRACHAAKTATESGRARKRRAR